MIMLRPFWQINTLKVDYHSARQRRPVGRSAPLQQAGHSLPDLRLSKKKKKKPLGRTQPDVNRTASGLPKSFSSSHEVCQPTEDSPVSQGKHPSWPSALVSSQHRPWMASGGMLGWGRPGSATEISSRCCHSAWIFLA